MTQLAQDTRDHEWLGYYDRFRYFSPEKVRDGCHPRIMEHPESTKKAIVLVHGLTDSPYFMTAIGDYFFRLASQYRNINQFKLAELDEMTR